jgi:S-DNA-T family DNA segregation ATPase FtsK/SpoIIIE
MGEEGSVSKLYFTADERAFFDRVAAHGLSRPKMHYWPIVRFAITQSLRLKTLPDERFSAPPGRGSELELEQITGFGKSSSENYDDEMRFLLSVCHQEDLFGDSIRYIDLLQRHARRGIEFMLSAWQPGRSYHDYLLDEIYADAAGSLPFGDAPANNLDFAALSQGLKQIGVSADSVGVDKEGPRLNRFSLTLSSVDDYDRLRKGLDDLAFAMGVGNAGIGLGRTQGERRVIVDVPRQSSTWHDVSWKTVQSELTGRSELLPVCPGVDVLGRAFVFDLAEAPHLFIAGATGSGKSVCLNALLLSMLISQRPPEFVMIDPKGVDFADYDGCNRLRGRHVITDMSAAVILLREIAQEMDERQKVLRDYSARNLAEAQANGASLERLVVVIDELADFMLGKSGASEPLIRLAQKARATGIHLILGTQRPEAATFPGLLRANIPSRIALTVQKAADSRIILDEGGAEKLLMRGDMLIKLAGRETLRAHGARIEPADIRAVVGEVNRR